MTAGQAEISAETPVSAAPMIALHDDEDRLVECHREGHRGGKIRKWRVSSEKG